MSRLAISLAEEAVEELRQEFHWYRQRSRVVAANFQSAIGLAFDRIQEHPDRYASYKHGTRRYRLQRFPFSIVYVVLTDRIHIIAVEHAKRRTAYWKKRLNR